MIELRPPGVTIQTRAESKILLPDYFVRFSEKFPDKLKVAGKTIRITKQQQVTYEKTYILKEACHKDLDISDLDTGEKLYPYEQDSLYEMIIALKPGNWYIIPYFPGNNPVFSLDYTDMKPLVTSAANKYLGTIRPNDSPFLLDTELGANAWALATFKLYLVYDMKPVYLRYVADDGVDYEQCTLEFLINRCKMVEEEPPPNVPVKPLYYLDEIRDMK